MSEGVEHYRGLVHSTARLVVSEGRCQDEYDDIVQVLYMKAWYAIGAFDASKSRMTQDRFVFMCVRNAVKDLQKKRRRGDYELSLEGVIESGEASGRLESRDKFDAKYLAAGRDQVYAEVEDEAPLLPNTLSRLEREVVLALAEGYTRSEVRAALDIQQREMERIMREVRTKLADWKPTQAPAPELALVVQLRVAA